MVTFASFFSPKQPSLYNLLWFLLWPQCENLPQKRHWLRLSPELSMPKTKQINELFLSNA
jgi:hypothetical protein